jgi:PAS domain S-box-containing protein
MALPVSPRAFDPTPLYDLTQAVAAARLPEEVYEAALDCIGASLGVERASILIFDAEGVMRFRAWRELSPEYRAAVDGHSPWSPSTTDPEPVLVADVLEEESLAELRPTIEREGIRSLAFIPLAIGGQLLGKFMLYHEQPHAFDEQEVLVARTIAAHVAFAIDQQAHRESDRRHRELIEALGVPVYTTDAQGRITFFNEAAVAIWGRRPELGKEHWCGSHRLYHADGTSMAHDECPMAISLREGRAVRGVEAVLERPDGTRVPFIPYPTPLRDSRGGLVGAVNVLLDITDRKLVESALQQSEQRARLLVEAMPALVLLASAGGDIEHINEGFTRFTGLTLEGARAWRELQLVHADDLERVQPAWGQPLGPGESLQTEMRLRRHDGVYRWHLVQAMPERDAGGRFLRWVMVGIDIDDRKRAEDCQNFLGEVTERAATLHDPAEIVAIVARLSVPALADICSIGFIDDSSETVRVETVGPNEDEAPHVARIHVRGWRARPDSHRRIGEVIGSGQAVLIPELTPAWINACAPNEEQRQVGLALQGSSVVCVPLAVRGDTIGMATFAYTRSIRRYTERDLALFTEVAARVGVAVDSARLFRDLRQTADDLLRANAAKDEFLGLVSHELRTPITTILGNAEILAERGDRLTTQERQTACADVAQEAARLNRLIDDLLTLARLERGKLEPEPLALGRVVTEFVQEYGDRRSTAVVECRDRSNSAIVLGDSNLITQVIRNYLTNAEKYSPRGSAIEVVVERAGDEGRVRVLDRGIGIDPAEAENLFEPFYRSRAAGSAGGLGIGLAVCRRLIEAVGGRVWAEPRDGGGSEFGLALTLCADDDGG